MSGSISLPEPCWDVAYSHRQGEECMMGCVVETWGAPGTGNGVVRRSAPLS